MIVVGSCYFLLTLLIPYDQNIDLFFPLSVVSLKYLMYSAVVVDLMTVHTHKSALSSLYFTD